jgi:aminoglycoside phosphotransferase (APT) family kinase protein
MDDLRLRLEAFASERLGRRVEIVSLERLSGGASRETWSFVIRDGDGERRLVLRRDPPGAPARSNRTGEIDLLRAAAAAGVPVPVVVWSSDDDALGSPGFVMEHVEGETIARKILRDEEFARARRVMAAQCGDILARIHATPTVDLTWLERPATTPADAILDQYTTVLDSIGEPHPALELALRWLRRNPPPSQRVTLVHGDFRNGNLIVGPDGIRAVIDWEISHIGDPWEDLAWLCMRSWRFGAPGEVGGFGDRKDLYASYEETSGVAVDVSAVQWWEVMANVKWGCATMMQAFTHLWGHVNSLELAAIGRRTVETEHDVLTLIG